MILFLDPMRRGPHRQPIARRAVAISDILDVKKT
jgi:hypothetical protein